MSGQQRRCPRPCSRVTVHLVRRAVARLPGREAALGTHALELQVASKTPIADAVVLLRLTASSGQRLPDWSPGAHIRLALPAGHRAYSLCGDRWDAQTYEIAVLREAGGRGGSTFIHDELTAGDRLMATPPRNNFPMIPSERYLFIAGGIGVTPFRPMLDQARRTGAGWHLLFGGKTRSGMAFTDELERHGDQVTLRPDDEFGPLDLDGMQDRLDPHTVIYCCGPDSLLRAVAERWGGTPHRLRTERFVGAEAVSADARPFSVVLANDGRRVTVPADMSLLDALAEQGVDVQGACLEGACGSCATRVLAGDVDHRDVIHDHTDDRPRTVMYPCVSRASSTELVLEL
jgi:ferredoxin-NADP reductase